ncbi:MAG: aminotransferase class V-fold PLP-dependent enzyme, partial [Steroidobacteraceae bacterium]|nr:aminotransferase class V-fold PLP-dependent enzyme [Steroidobacteraceae bacterium]
MSAVTALHSEPYDAARVRADFPILAQRVNGHRLAYLDSAASAQQPRAVIEAVAEYHARDHANVHRGVHTLSQRATERLEQARRRVQQFLNARRASEIVFVRGTTEAINLVANSWGRTQLRAGDDIVLTTLEHHANIVPWQFVCAATGARLRVAPITPQGELDWPAFVALLGPRTRLVACAHVSNALGTVLPVAKIAAAAHAVGAILLLDGAQAAPHETIDVQALDCDFYAFSAHKVYGPTGIGV